MSNLVMHVMDMMAIEMYTTPITIYFTISNTAANLKNNNNTCHNLLLIICIIFIIYVS